MKKIFFLFIFLCFLHTAFSQNNWSVRFGTEEFTGLAPKNLPEDLPLKIVRNSEGMLFISGTNDLSTGEPKENSMGCWIAKFNKNGQLLWYRVAAPNILNCVPEQITATSDGGVVLSGFDNGYNERSKDALLLYKLDAEGNLLNKVHYADNLAVGEKIAESDGSPIFTFENTDGNISVIATVTVRIETRQGNVIRSEPKKETWLLNFTQDLEFIDAVSMDIPDISISNNDFSIYSKFDNTHCSDGSFAIVKKERDKRSKLWVFKFDKNGNKLWDSEISQNGTIYNFGITHNEKGETAVYYYTNENNDPKYLLKIYNESGEIISERKIFNSTKGVFPISLSKIIFSGDDIWLINNPGGGEGIVEIKKINSAGKEYFSKSFGVKGSFLSDCVETEDNGLAALGYTKDYNASYIDALIIKVSKDGAATPTVSKYTKAIK